MSLQSITTLQLFIMEHMVWDIHVGFVNNMFIYNHVILAVLPSSAMTLIHTIMR